MSRPKRVILCVGVDDVKLSQRVFMLKVHGYHVLRARSAAEALMQIQMLAGGRSALDAVQPLAIDMLLMHLPLVDVEETMRLAKSIEPEIHTMITSDGSGYEGTTHADAYMVRGTWSAAELLERIKVLLTRKRGPKKAVASCGLQVAGKFRAAVAAWNKRGAA